MLQSTARNEGPQLLSFSQLSGFNSRPAANASARMNFFGRRHTPDNPSKRSSELSPRSAGAEYGWLVKRGEKHKNWKKR